MTHHLCIANEYCTFDGEPIPIGKHMIERDTTKAINEVLDSIIHKIGKDNIVVCGIGDARRMLGRKLEDRLGRQVTYE